MRPYMRRTPIYPSNNPNPLIRQIFDRQDELMMTLHELERRSGVSIHIIRKLRRPMYDGGRNTHIEYIQKLAEAVGLEWPEKLGVKKHAKRDTAGSPELSRGRNDHPSAQIPQGGGRLHR